MNDLIDPPFYFLRSDFGVEIGFLDAIRNPHSEKQFAEWCKRREQVFSHAAWRDHNERRARRHNPDHLVYGGAIPKGETSAVPFITDGTLWYYPPLAGLFSEMLARARMSMGEAQRELPFGFPEPRTTPADRWIWPAFASFHYCTMSQAIVTPFDSCMNGAKVKNLPQP